MLSKVYWENKFFSNKPESKYFDICTIFLHSILEKLALGEPGEP